MTSRRDFLKTGALIGPAALVGSTAAQAEGAKRSFSGESSYSATAKPKPWLLPQRKGPPVSIDMHTHWAPPGYLKAKADLGHPDFLDPINADMDRRIAWMDQNGVQIMVLTLGGFRPWGWVTPEQGANISRISNDAAIEAHKAHPQRVLAGIELNCTDPAGSLVELNRVAGKPGMVCIHLPTSVGGKDFLFDDAFQPILKRADELGLPIFLHPLDGEPNWFLGHRLADVASGADPHASEVAARFPGLTNSLGNQLEISVCMAKLINSGTLDRYPNLTFIMPQGGGAIPYVMGRMENRGGDRLKQPVYSYLRRFYYDSLVYWPVTLRYLAEMVGSDRIVLGTDNMYGPGRQLTEQPHSVIDQADFTDADRDLILHGNLKRLFKL